VLDAPSVVVAKPVGKFDPPSFNVAPLATLNVPRFWVLLAVKLPRSSVLLDTVRFCRNVAFAASVLVPVPLIVTLV